MIDPTDDAPDIIRAFLFDTLSTDDEIRQHAPLRFDDDPEDAPERETASVWYNLASQNALMPYIVISTQSGGNSDNGAGMEVFVNPVMLVKVISIVGEQDDASRLIRKRIKTLLQKARLYHEAMYLRVKTAGLMPEFQEQADGGRHYYHRGRFWRFYISQGQAPQIAQGEG